VLERESVVSFALSSSSSKSANEISTGACDFPFGGRFFLRLPVVLLFSSTTITSLIASEDDSTGRGGVSSTSITVRDDSGRDTEVVETDRVDEWMGDGNE
jgi:hypothetical protein